MKNIKGKVKQLIVKTGEATAFHSVGKSDPVWIYEVEVPEVLRRVQENNKMGEKQK